MSHTSRNINELMTPVCWIIVPVLCALMIRIPMSRVMHFCEWPLLSPLPFCRHDVHVSVSCNLSIIVYVRDCILLFSTSVIAHVCVISCGTSNSYLIESDFLIVHIFITGTTLISREYLSKYDRETDCTGEYTIQTYTIGACSTGGVKYQIVSGTASLVPSLAPTAFSSALTLELSGYSVAAKYSDNKCNILTSAVSYPLNSCNEHESGYAKYTATAYSIARTEYSDSLCKTATSTLGPTYIDYTALCVDDSESSGLALVNANGVPPSPLPMASIRLVHTMSLPCVIANLPYSWLSQYLSSLSLIRSDLMWSYLIG